MRPDFGPVRELAIVVKRWRSGEINDREASPLFIERVDKVLLEFYRMAKFIESNDADRMVSCLALGSFDSNQLADICREQAEICHALDDSKILQAVALSKQSGSAAEDC